MKILIFKEAMLQVMRHLQSLFIISESLHFQRKFKICKCQQCLLPTVNSPLPCNNSSPIAGGGYSSKVSVVLYNVCSTQLFKSCPVLFHTKMSFFAPIFWKKIYEKNVIFTTWSSYTKAFMCCSRDQGDLSISLLAKFLGRSPRKI